MITPQIRLIEEAASIQNFLHTCAADKTIFPIERDLGVRRTAIMVGIAVRPGIEDEETLARVGQSAIGYFLAMNRVVNSRS